MSVNPVTFLKETLDELKKVTWPNQKEVIRLTAMVIVVSIGIGLFVGGLDLLFTKLMETILK